MLRLFIYIILFYSFRGDFGNILLAWTSEELEALWDIGTRDWERKLGTWS